MAFYNNSKTRFHVSLIVASLMFLTSCQSMDSMEKVSRNGQTIRADGSALAWSLTGFNPQQPNPILLIAQGSGCEPARTSINVRQLAAAAQNFASLTIEKYGVTLDDTPLNPMESCSDAYFTNHTVSQRVLDGQTVLQNLKRQKLWDDKLVLFGGSEGGAVVSILSHTLPEVDATIVFSSGAGLTLAEFFPMVVPPPVAVQMKDVFAQLRKNPETTGIIAGNSYKWWADIMDRRLSDDLLKSKAPVLLIHGVNDKSAPVASSQAAKIQFDIAGQAERLSYWELPDRDHKMVDSKGNSHMHETLVDVMDWVHKN